MELTMLTEATSLSQGTLASTELDVAAATIFIPTFQSFTFYSAQSDMIYFFTPLKAQRQPPGDCNKVRLRGVEGKLN